MNTLLRRWWWWWACGVAPLAWGDASPAGFVPRAQHVVVIVWDGMRPDFVRADTTPALAQLVKHGVFFSKHHPVYISTTEVNGTALATGCYPHRDGIIANRVYLPTVSALTSVATESEKTIRRVDEMTGGHYLGAPTMAEILQAAGIPTAVAGSKPVAILQDRSNQRVTPAALQSTVLYAGQTLPRTALEGLIRAVGGPFPSAAVPNAARDVWTTRALVRGLWRDGVPKFSLVWLSEPDSSQHAASPGSRAALEALRNNDNDLATVLQALEDKHVREQTDMLLVSDHAFSTIERGVNVVAALNAAGFHAGLALDQPRPGDVLVVPLGGSALFYVIEHDPAVTQRLVEFLQRSDFAGVIFSRLTLEGTFPLGQVRLDINQFAPDVVVAARWRPDKNRYGAPGVLVGLPGTAGAGTHGSLSRFDMHNTLVAVGPDFRRGFVDTLPSGNADVAPTVLALLGVPQPQPMEGRVLQEALVGVNDPPPVPQQKTIETGSALGAVHWAQYLEFSLVGDAMYFDEGNGAAAVK